MVVVLCEQVINDNPVRTQKQINTCRNIDEKREQQRTLFGQV